MQPSCKGEGSVAVPSGRSDPPHELDYGWRQTSTAARAESRALVAGVSEQPPLRSGPVSAYGRQMYAAHHKPVSHRLRLRRRPRRCAAASEAAPVPSHAGNPGCRKAWHRHAVGAGIAGARLAKIATAKGSSDTTDRDVRSYAGDIIVLAETLRDYGADAATPA